MKLKAMRNIAAAAVAMNASIALFALSSPAYAAACGSKEIGCVPASACVPGSAQSLVCNGNADPGCTYVSAQCIDGGCDVNWSYLVCNYQ